MNKRLFLKVLLPSLVLIPFLEPVYRLMTASHRWAKVEEIDFKGEWGVYRSMLLVEDPRYPTMDYLQHAKEIEEKIMSQVALPKDSITHSHGMSGIQYERSVL